MLQPLPKIKIRECFAKKSSLFIPFMIAGYPTLAITQKAILALAANGADIIELGVPFSDPIADGPINQKAAEIALKNGASLRWCLRVVQSIRSVGCQTPIVLFSYFNPIFVMGIEEFAKKANAVGINGVLIVDLPPEEGKAIYETFHRYQIEPILLLSPTTNLKRLPLYHALNPGFLYYISRLNVTGVQHNLSSSLLTEITALRKELFDIPIAIGFGISTAEQAKEVAKIAEGIIVGSTLVQTLEQHGIAAFSLLASQLKQAVDQGPTHLSHETAHGLFA